MKIQHWWKTLKRSTQLLIITTILITAGVVAYAAFSTFVISPETPGGITDVPFVEVELNVSGFTGPVTPGDAITGSVSITNSGNGRGMGYVRFKYPVISSSSSTPGMAGSAYSWTLNDGWTAVEEGVGYTVYGYSTALDGDEESSSPFDVIVMKEISNAEYKALDGNVNVSFVGYMADCNTYGDDPQVVWEAANR